MASAAIRQMNGYIVPRFIGLQLELLGVGPVAVNTPAHIELGRDFNLGHVLNITMTVGAIQTTRDVCFVIEASMVGQVVDFVPAKRNALLIRGAEVLNVLAVTGHVFMTLHASG